MKKLIIATMALLSFSSAFAGNEIKCSYTNKENGETYHYDLNKYESVEQYFGTSRLNVQKQERGYVVALETLGNEDHSEYRPIKMFMIDNSEGTGEETVFLDLEYSSFTRPEQKVTCKTKYKVMFAR